MSMPCGSLLLGVQCCYPYFFFLSFYLRTWLMLYWRATSLCLGSLLFRMLFPYGVIVIYNNVNTQLELISTLSASLSHMLSFSLAGQHCYQLSNVFCLSIGIRTLSPGISHISVVCDVHCFYYILIIILILEWIFFLWTLTSILFLLYLF